MTLSILLLIVGLLLLVGGADLLIRGVSSLAESVGVPSLVIGLTVVAFGTSTPELVVNGYAAFHGQTELAFGSIVGSSAINIGFVLALTAVVHPLTVRPTIITREIPMMILGVVAMLVMANDRYLNHAAVDSLSRADGIILLLLFCVFVYYTIRGMVQHRRTDGLIEEVAASNLPRRPRRGLAVVLTIAGLAGVALGGRLTVGSAVSLATAMKIPETIIGLTIVSFGTTLPELMVGVIAVRRGQNDIAIGNVVGSCIYNSLFIGGLVSVICPVPIPQGGIIDLLMLGALSVGLLPIAMRGPRKITRVEGAVLLAAYLSYTIYRAGSAAGSR